MLRGSLDLGVRTACRAASRPLPNVGFWAPLSSPLILRGAGMATTGLDVDEIIETLKQQNAVEWCRAARHYWNLLLHHCCRHLLALLVSHRLEGRELSRSSPYSPCRVHLSLHLSHAFAVASSETQRQRLSEVH